MSQKLENFTLQILRSVYKKYSHRGEEKPSKKQDYITFNHNHLSQSEIAEEFAIVQKPKEHKVTIFVIVALIAGLFGIARHFDYFRTSYFITTTEENEHVDYLDSILSGIDTSLATIVVIPFNEVCQYKDRSIDVGLAITLRLEELATEDSIQIEPIYLNKYSDQLSPEDLVKEYNIPILVYGNYLSVNCSSQNEVCINYILSDFIKDVIPVQEVTGHSYRPFEPRDLLHGELQSEIETIIYWLELLATHSSRNNAERAIKLATTLIENYNLDNASIYTIRAINLMEDSTKLQEARIDLNAAIEKDTSISSYYFYRGLISYNEGAMTEALRAFNEAVGLDTTVLEYNYIRGLTPFRLGLNYHSNLDFTRLYLYGWRSTNVIYYICNNLIRQGDFENAENFASECLMIDPLDGHCQFLLAEIDLLLRKDTSGFIFHLKEAGKIDSTLTSIADHYIAYVTGEIDSLTTIIVTHDKVSFEEIKGNEVE